MHDNAGVWEPETARTASSTADLLPWPHRGGGGGCYYFKNICLSFYGLPFKTNRFHALGHTLGRSHIGYLTTFT